MQKNKSQNQQTSSNKNPFSCLADMRPIFRIINIHFWKSYVGPFFAFIFPIIFIAILGTMLVDSVMLGGFMSTAVVAVAMCSMPQAIFEFKQSTLLKRIGATPIRPWMFMTSAAIYYIAIMIAGTVFSFLMILAIFAMNFEVGKVITETYFAEGVNPATGTAPLLAMSIKDTLANVNWWQFIWANIMNILVSVSLSLVFVSLCKSSMVITGVATPILIISGFLSGQYLPLYLINQGDGIIAKIGYITPFKSPIGLMMEAWSGKFAIEQILNVDGGIDHYQVVGQGYLNIFDINDEFYVLAANPMSDQILVYNKIEKIINLILPFAWTGIFVTVSLKYFKWSV